MCGRLTDIVLQLLSKSGLGFSERLIRKVMIEADINSDKMIQWDEFVPVMLEILDAHRVRDYSHADEHNAIVSATAFVMDGKNQRDVERWVRKMFMESDVDNNGVLDKGEFLACMRQLDFGLTTKEINYLLTQVHTALSVAHAILVNDSGARDTYVP